MTKFGCNYTSSTTNRGVEAKEVEIGNTRLDRNTTESTSSFPADSSAPSEPLAPSADVSGSYVQVVVHKHRRARAAAAAQTSPRLPAASSPIRQVGETAGAGDGNMLLLPASVLLACPSQQQSYPQYKIVCERVSGGAADAAAGASACGRGDEGPRRATALPPARSSPEKIPKNTGWKILSNIIPDEFDSSDNVPERVEVYYFERSSGAYLATSGAARARRVEAARRRVRRAAGAWAAELLAAAHLLLALPAALLVGLQRCVLAAARDALTGGVQTAADYALKPALALAFNALLQPPLVFCANVARALREALLPLTQLAGDAAEPLCRALRSLRLVHVHIDSPAHAPCLCGRGRPADA